MLGHSALFALFLVGTCWSQANPGDPTVLDLAVGSLGPLLTNPGRQSSCNSPDKMTCFSADLQQKQAKKYDANNDGNVDKNEITKALENDIEAVFDTLDNNNDGQIELSLEKILFNIKTDILRPAINKVWSLLGENYNIKPSDFIQDWNANDPNSWSNLIEKFSEGDKDNRKEYDLVRTLINTLDKNKDGQFNKQETTDATIAILKLADDNNDGIVTLEEVIKFAKGTGMFSESKLDDAKKAIESTVKAIGNKVFTPIMARLDENKDNKISKNEAKKILTMKFKHFKAEELDFGAIQGQFMGPTNFLSDKSRDPENIYELAKNTVEDLKNILENSKGFENGSNGRSCYPLMILLLIFASIYNL